MDSLVSSLSLIRRSLEYAPFRIGLMNAIIALILFVSWQSFIVHYNFSGDYASVLMPGQPFGVPEREAAMGMKPVTIDAGWDGQFYYYLSNDPFLRRDARNHMVSGMYSGQRIGYPIIPHVVCKILGLKLVPPRMYLMLQWVIISISLGFLAGWLVTKNQSPWFAWVWGLSFGMIFSTERGLPDGVGDAWFIFTLMAASTGRLKTYAFCSTMLLLTREGYAAFGGMVFFYTAIGWIRWPENYTKLKQLVFTALPGIIMFSWTAYLSIHLDESPLTARSNPSIAGNPYVALCEAVLLDFNQNWHHEVKWKIVTGLFMAWTLLLVLINGRSSPLLCATWAYIFLAMMLGSMVWANHMGHPKAMGTIILIGIFLLPIEKSAILRIGLFGMLFTGLDIFYFTRVQFPDFMSPARVEMTLPIEIDPNSPKNQVLTDFRVGIDWENRFEKLELPTSIWKPFHREQLPIRLTITNRSNETWYPNPTGATVGAIRSVVRVTPLDDENNILDTQVATILGRVRPGESIRMIHRLILKPGKYWLALTMVQEGMNLFNQRNPNEGGIKVAIEIK
jgi:hypothetical protein